MQKIEEEKIKYLKYIIENFDNFLTNVEYVYKKNYRFGDYEYILHKLNEETIYVYIFHNKVEILKKNNDKFEITINLDDYLTIAKQRRITRFLKTENDYYYTYLISYYRGVWHLILADLRIPIRVNSRKIKLTIKRKTKEYYVTLPELLKVPIPEKKYGFPIVSGKLYLYKFNNKKVEDVINYYQKKYKGMPYINRIKLQNRKIEYQFTKMLLKKKIFQYDYSYIFNPILRIKKSEIEYNVWRFSNIALPVIEKMRGNQFPIFLHSALQDVDDDGVNQILLKYIDERNHTFLCGVDYGNSIWCMQLQGFMLKFRIKSVYKTLYQLDDKTKIFEF